MQIMIPAAQDIREPVPLTRIQGVITIDGSVSEPAWDAIPLLPLISYEPIAGLPPSEETEIRIAYDDDYIYASIRAYDSDPSGIRINSLYRNRLSGDDVFHILLDTYNDFESAVGFTITPSGAKRDAAISNDGEGPNALNADFNTYWDVATRVTDEGWFAEVRIPFSSLGFQDDDGRVTMGLYVQRGISRKNERVTWPEVPSNIARAYFKPSRAQRVRFEGIYSRRPLHITPYITGGLGQQYRLNEEASSYRRSDTWDADAGFDIKYGLSSSLTLDLTVNTDFAQAEADDQQVNLTRFNLFFPEKRQFFQERSGLFEFNTGGNGRLFHSRRIGISPAGEPVRILAGGRLTGRLGAWDLGLLNMQTEKDGELPAENFGVIRLRREIVNPYSYAGFMATTRAGSDGSYNLGLGLDGSIRLQGEDYVTWAWAQSIEEETLDLSVAATSRARLGWERRSREGFAWETSLSRSGTDYNPGSGFVPRLDYLRAAQSLMYGWLPAGTSQIHWHTVQVDGALFWSTSGNDLESAEAGAGWEASARSGSLFETDLRWHYESIITPFRLLNRTVIPAGEYRFFRASAGYRTAPGRLLRLRADLDGGTFYGGWRYTLNVAPVWNVSKHLELEASWNYNLVDVASTDEPFAVHLGQLRVRTALDTRLSTHAFVQFNTSADIVTANVRFRYNIRDGNDIWIVYNEGLHTSRDRVEPMLPRSEARTLLVKYTHTFHR